VIASEFRRGITKTSNLKLVSVNRQLFLQLLAHPESVSELASIELKKFTEDFPYCQTGQLLFVKHLHLQQSVHYPEQLKTAAAYAVDRKLLYHLLHSPVKETDAETSNTSPSIFVQSDAKEQPDSKIIQENKVTEEAKAQTELIEKRLKEISRSKIEIPLEKPDEQEVISRTESESISVKIDENIPDKKVVSIEIEEHKKETDYESGKHSFTEWLKTVKKESLAKRKVEKAQSKPASSTDEIINSFIEAEPRIVPSKAEFYNPVKAAKQSLEEHDDLVSETLANLFAQQGNPHRAIEIFKKLMLLHPEKSTLFAARIKNLTEQLNPGK
jgi:hypothetical protein